MNPRDQQLLDLVKSLLQKTLQSRILWRRTERAGRYLYVSDAASVLLQGPTGPLSKAVGQYSLKIIDGSGNTIDGIEASVNPGMLAVSSLDNTSQLELLRTVHPVLQELFREVEEQVAKPNPTIGNLIDEIDTK